MNVVFYKTKHMTVKCKYAVLTLEIGFPTEFG